MRILLVEDDQSIVEVLTAVLVEQNYVVDVAIDGEAGWDLIESYPYDLVLLDVMLPKIDGISFCRRLRQRKSQVLVMLLTARDTTTDKLMGLDSGADDYVVKPFNVEELAARIRALLRRGSTSVLPVLACGGLQLDPNTREVRYAGSLLQFSRKEYLLLELFMRQPQRVFSRREIVDQLWSVGEDPPDEDTVKSHVKNVRRELKAAGVPDLIETIYGQGYRLHADEPIARTEAAIAPAPTLDAAVAENLAAHQKRQF
ncbi:MAG: response regulator transcription factor [Leptolyngbyaceae cyanobacterium SM1_3_5]|nr:response regulator transcription factor [Leptolyngbyaceae cyanobacterium SM1_3_5]